MNRDQLDKWLEWVVAALAAVILLFGPLALGAVRTPEFVILQSLTVALGLVWVARLWLSPRAQLFWPPVSWAVLLFVIYAAARYRLADIEYVARHEVIRVAIYAVLFLVVLNNSPRLEPTRFIVFCLVGLAVCLAGFAIYQFFTHDPKVWGVAKPPAYATRGSGTYMNPNHLAGLLEMILPLSLACALFGRFGHVTRILLAYATAVLLVGVGVTGSRGGWISVCASLVIFFGVLLFQSRFRWRALFALGVLLAVGIYFGQSYGRRAARMEYSFAAGRLTDIRRDIWPVTLAMWHDHFWLGVGPGHFDHRFKEYRGPLVQLQARPGYAHNDYLNALADWGSAGALLIALVWLLFYAEAFHGWRRLRDSVGSSQSNTMAVVLGGTTGTFALLVHSCLDFNFQIPANAILAVTLLALATGQAHSLQKQKRMPGLLARLLATLAMLPMLVWLSHQAHIAKEEYHWLEQAEQENLDAQTRLKDYQNAFEAENKNPETAFAIGELYRALSWAGGPEYKKCGEKAIDWFQKAVGLNPYDAESLARIGMCLDWLGRTQEADPYFARADQLDPNGYGMRALQGIHQYYKGEYVAAKAWLEKSLTLRAAWENPRASNYLSLVNRKLAETPAPKAP